MISDKMKFQVGKLTVEVNWKKEVTPCKQIRVTLDGKEEIIEHADFYSMMILFGDDKQQEDLLESKTTLMRMVKRMLTVKAKTDMKAGESLSVPYVYTIPDAEYQRLKGLGQKIELVQEKA